MRCFGFFHSYAVFSFTFSECYGNHIFVKWASPVIYILINIKTFIRPLKLILLRIMGCKKTFFTKYSPLHFSLKWQLFAVSPFHSLIFRSWDLHLQWTALTPMETSALDLSVCSSVTRARNSVEPVSLPAPPVGTGPTLHQAVLVRQTLSNPSLFVHQFSEKILHFSFAHIEF